MGSFGDLIREARTRRGLTQAQLADAVGVKQPAVSDWETGDSYPETARVPKIGAALRLSAEWLFAALAADVAATQETELQAPPPEARHGNGHGA